MLKTILGVGGGLALMLPIACGGTGGSTSDDTEATSEALCSLSPEAAKDAAEDALDHHSPTGTRVDPNTLKPPAVLEDEPWLQARPYNACWRTHGREGGPVGTAIKCFAATTKFHKGDGSLDGANGNPDFYFFLGCDADGFYVSDSVDVTWSAVRFYDGNLNLLQGIRSEKFSGKLINMMNGKTVDLTANDFFVYDEKPADGTLDHEIDTILGQNFLVKKGTKVLASSGPLITFDGNAGTIVREVGPQPLFDYYFKGDTTGIAPVCAALK